jgi:hypothetical protein
MALSIPNIVPFVVLAAIGAANAHDTDEFLDVIAPDATVEHGGRAYAGVEQIRAWSDRQFIGRKVQLTDLWCTSIGQEHAIAAQVGGNGFTGPATFTFTVANDLVSRMRIDSANGLWDVSA